MSIFTNRVTAVVAGAAVLATVGATGSIVAASAADDSATVIRSAQLNTSETRPTGHVEFLRDGLHVWTEGSTSTDKAAGYFEVHMPLSEVTSAEITWIGTQPQASAQIMFDADDQTGNGNDYNVLVAEPVYGDKVWLTGGSSQAAKDADPSGNENGGNGSEWFGTLAQWSAALPQARMYAGGFSLGSGVKGDGYIESLTYGDDEFRFSSIAETTPPAPRVQNVTGNVAFSVFGTRARKLAFISNETPAGRAEGRHITWRVTVDGRTAAILRQGAGDHDAQIYRFARRTGTHKIVVFRNGDRHRTWTVSTRR